VTAPRGSVLLVEDDPGLVRTLGDRLRADGWAVTVAGDGDRALAAARSGAHDLILLDLMLPVRDGVDVLHTLRADGITTPVIVLSARGAVADRVQVLTLGADDYLPKPFRADELRARIDAVLRRVRGAALSPHERVIRFGEWELDLEREELRRSGAVEDLSRTEYELLAYLIRRRGRPVTRNELLREVWRYAPTVASRTVDQHVAQVRRKLDPAEPSRYILAVRGRGYTFRAHDVGGRP
jgi:two-component system alkaline phosphatase synthesis response regulator PhoP